MGLARGTKRTSKPKPKLKGNVAFPFVLVVALPLFIVLDLYATRDYDTSVVGACIVAVIEALAAWLWFGGPSKSDLEDYFWKRLLGLIVVTAVFMPIAYFAIGWPLLTSIAISLGAALAAGIAIMAKMGDL